MTLSEPQNIQVVFKTLGQISGVISPEQSREKYCIDLRRQTFNFIGTAQQQMEVDPLVYYL
jgi:hypothetical protein